MNFLWFEGIAGDVHFDDDEDFRIGTPKGTDLLWVATHEIGHSLGLEHSNQLGAIMYPWYQGYKKDFKLQPDDASGIRALYGMNAPFRYCSKAPNLRSKFLTP